MSALFKSVVKFSEGISDRGAALKFSELQKVEKVGESKHKCEFAVFYNNPAFLSRFVGVATATTLHILTKRSISYVLQRSYDGQICSVFLAAMSNGRGQPCPEPH